MLELSVRTCSLASAFKHVHKQICHVSLSIWKDLALNSPIFMKSDNGGLLLKLVRKILVWLNLDKNIGHYTWRPKYVYNNILLDSSWMERSFWENYNIFHIKHIFSESHAFVRFLQAIQQSKMGHTWLNIILCKEHLSRKYTQC